MRNARKHRDINLTTTEVRRNYLVLEPNFHMTNFFSENLLTIGMKRTWILINKPVYLGLPTFEMSKIVMYYFWYDR